MFFRFFELFLNKWHDYSGGSEIGVNKMGIFEVDDGYQLHLSYIFDKDEGSESVYFNLTKDETISFIKDLAANGNAILKKKGKSESLYFEMKQNEGVLRFRIEGRGRSPTQGFANFLMMDFKDIIGSPQIFQD